VQRAAKAAAERAKAAKNTTKAMDPSGVTEVTLPNSGGRDPFVTDINHAKVFTCIHSLWVKAGRRLVSIDPLEIARLTGLTPDQVRAAIEALLASGPAATRARPGGQRVHAPATGGLRSSAMGTRGELFSGDNTQRRPCNSWLEYATASNDAATVEREADATARHYITSIHASFVDEASAAKTLTLKYGSDTIAVWSVKGARDLVFDPPLQAPEDQDVSVTLAAGGSGVVGHVVMNGLSL
jgi:hypothetical protein